MTWIVVGPAGERSEHELQSGALAAVRRHRGNAVMGQVPDAPTEPEPQALVFRAWLDAQTHRHDDVGAFARWAKHAIRRSLPEGASFGRWLHELIAAEADHRTQRALVQSWEEWQTSPQP